MVNDLHPWSSESHGKCVASIKLINALANVPNATTINILAKSPPSSRRILVSQSRAAFTPSSTSNRIYFFFFYHRNAYVFRFYFLYSLKRFFVYLLTTLPNASRATRYASILLKTLSKAVIDWHLIKDFVLKSYSLLADILRLVGKHLY